MNHVFVPLDIRSDLDSRYVEQDRLEEFKKLDILPVEELVKKDLFDVLSFFPKTSSGKKLNIDHKYMISPFKILLTDLDLLDKLSKRFENTFGKETVIHITMSEHTAILLGREFWIKAVPNFNLVISDVWEPSFLHVNDKLSMTNVFKGIREFSDPVPPHFVSFIKPNADPRMNKWLNVNKIPKSSFFNFDYFIFDTYYQSGVESVSSKYEKDQIIDIDLYLKEIQSAKKTKKLVCLNRSHKFHRPKLVNDLYANNLFKNSYISLAEIKLPEEEEYDVVKNEGMPILADKEPEENIVKGKMMHDSVANIEWVKNAELFVSTESLMYDTSFEIPDHTPYFVKFISEKVHKPLAWGMPFVVFGCQGSLTHMKDIGFKTFDPLIDESYDSIEDPEERYQSALQSVKDFASNEYPRSEINKITEYNLKFYYSEELYIQLTETLINEILNTYLTKREQVDFNFNQ